MVKLPVNIIYSQGDSPRPGEYSPALQPDIFTAKNGKPFVIDGPSIFMATPFRPGQVELQQNANPTAYIDVFVDRFLGLTQGTAHRQHQIQSTLLYTLDNLL